MLSVYEISNLGVIFDSTLTYNKHLLYRMILGFITRNYKDFTNPVIKTL